MSDFNAIELADKICHAQYECLDSYGSKANKNILGYSDREEKVKVIYDIVIDYFKNINISDYEVAIATLQAKVYAYEKIIANSNFAAVLEQPAVPMNVSVEEFANAMKESQKYVR